MAQTVDNGVDLFTTFYQNFVVNEEADQLPPSLGRLPRDFDYSSVLLWLGQAYRLRFFELTNEPTRRYRDWMRTVAQKTLPGSTVAYPEITFIGVGDMGEFIGEKLLGSLRHEDEVLKSTAHYGLTMYPRDGNIRLPDGTTIAMYDEERGERQLTRLENGDTCYRAGKDSKQLFADNRNLTSPNARFFVFCDDTDRLESGEMKDCIDYTSQFLIYHDSHTRPQIAPNLRVATLSLGINNGLYLAHNQVSLTTQWNMGRLHGWIWDQFRKYAREVKGNSYLVLNIGGGGHAWTDNMRQVLPAVLKRSADVQGTEFVNLWLNKAEGRLYYTDRNQRPIPERPFDPESLYGRRAMFVDDMVGSGRTMSGVKNVLGDNVMYAALVNLNPYGFPWVKTPLRLNLR